MVKKKKFKKNSVAIIDVSGDIPFEEEFSRKSSYAQTRKSRVQEKAERDKKLALNRLEDEKSVKDVKDVSKAVGDDGKIKKRKRRSLATLVDVDQRNGSSTVSKRLAKIDNKINNVLAVTGSTFDVSLDNLTRENLSEQHFQDEYNIIFSSLGSLCRKLERDMSEKDSKVSSRDVYALMTMYSQMRETIADLRSIADINTQSEMLVSEVLLPYHKTVGEMMVSLLYKLMTHLRQSLNEASAYSIGDRLQEIVSEEALSLQKQFENTKLKITTVLSASR